MCVFFLSTLLISVIYQQFNTKCLVLSGYRIILWHGTLQLRRPESETDHTLTSITQLYSSATVHLYCLSASCHEKVAIYLLVLAHYFTCKTCDGWFSYREKLCFEEGNDKWYLSDKICLTWYNVIQNARYQNNNRKCYILINYITDKVQIKLSSLSFNTQPYTDTSRYHNYLDSCSYKFVSRNLLELLKVRFF
jgi:hypothetical protein